MRFAQACAVFKLDPRTVTWGQVRTVYRHAARLVHPDCGGDRVAWDEFQEAYHLLKAELDRPRRCQACSGSGVRAFMRRGRLVSEACQACHGQGDLPPET